MRFDQTIKRSTPKDRRGSSANTGDAVIRLTKAGRQVSLALPLETDLASVEGLAAVNERLRQIEEHLRQIDQREVQLAAKFGFGTLAALTATAQPVPGCKLVLDKLGSWLVLVTADWDSDGVAQVLGFSVVDPETEAQAKKQDAEVRATFSGAARQTSTAWSLFTATTIPRLVQFYAKRVSGAATVDLDPEGTSICAIWLGKWQPGEKRFGRHIPSEFSGALDMNADALTDHGEEARWPRSDHPDVVSHGVNQTGL